MPRCGSWSGPGEGFGSISRDKDGQVLLDQRYRVDRSGRLQAIDGEQAKAAEVSAQTAFSYTPPVEIMSARNVQGATLWSIRKPMGRGFRQVSKDGQGRVWLDGSYGVDPVGRLLSVESDGVSALSEPTAEAAVAFETPVETSLGDPYRNYNSATPLIDSSGNAWVVIVGYGPLYGIEDTLQLARYDRVSASFLTPALGWSPLRPVPGTANAGIPGGTGPTSFIPATVDDRGDVTVPSYIQIRLTASDSLWVVRATRLEGGVWQAPQLITVHRDWEPLLVNFGDADYSGDGDVFIICPRTFEEDAMSHYTVFHYVAGAGAWETPVALNTQLPGETRSRIVYRSDGSALATFLDSSRPSRSLIGRLYRNGVWGTEAIPVPGDPVTGWNETTADGLDVVMAYDDDDSSFGTWLRDMVP